MRNSQSILRISIVQYPIRWLDKGQNLRTIEDTLAKHGKESDLIILPEMFNTGFYTKPHKIAELPSGPTFQWMEKISRRLNSTIGGSLCLRNKEGKFTNSFILVSNGQIVHRYDKRHLFSFADESLYMSKGEHRESILFNSGWKIRPFICYDIRFPVWLRNDDQYDLLLGVSNFPDARIKTWKTLCTARAIENQSYLVGVNGMGTDPDGIYYSGHSLFIAPDGEVLSDTKEANGVFHFELDKKFLQQIRSKYPFLKDRDPFTILGNESN